MLLLLLLLLDVSFIYRYRAMSMLCCFCCYFCYMQALFIGTELCPCYVVAVVIAVICKLYLSVQSCVHVILLLLLLLLLFVCLIVRSRAVSMFVVLNLQRMLVLYIIVIQCYTLLYNILVKLIHIYCDISNPAFPHYCRAYFSLPRWTSVGPGGAISVWSTPQPSQYTGSTLFHCWGSISGVVPLLEHCWLLIAKHKSK